VKRDTGLACLALALLLAGMSVAGRFAAEEDEPMKDPQQHNHQAWQASPYGRSWQAEAERKSLTCNKAIGTSKAHGTFATEPQRRGEHQRLQTIFRHE
jgi:hypothetical protein